MFSLDGKLAFITGGTSGIGAAVARRFAASGARVIIVGRRDGTAVAGQIGAHYRRADVTDEKGLADTIKAVAEEFGKIDLFVNNAGVQDTGLSIEDHDLSAFDKNIAILQKGVYLGLKYAPQYMNDGGSIINTSSIAAVIGVPGYGQYAMAKAAILSLTRVAAVELASRRIRVNAVMPGTIRTPMVENEPEEIALTAALAPLGRIGEVEEAVGVYHFLAADESSYVTGQQIAVDGGLTAGISASLLENLASA